MGHREFFVRHSIVHFQQPSGRTSFDRVKSIASDCLRANGQNGLRVAVEDVQQRRAAGHLGAEVVRPHA
jgi:hypothetical protein